MNYAIESRADYLPLLQQLNELIYGPHEIPDELRQKLRDIPPPDAERFVRGAEMLYAYFDELPPFGVKVMGDMFEFASRQPWTRFNTDNKAVRIVWAARRELGEEGNWPDPSEDPDRGDPMFSVHRPPPAAEPETPAES